MNYWPAEVTNLAECHEPLFDLIEELREPGATHGAGALRGARLGRPPQHRPVARGDAGRRRPLGPVADGRRLALDAPLRALRLQRRPRVPAKGLSRAEGGVASSCSTSWSRTDAGPARDEPLALARERVPRRERQRGRALRGRDDGLRDHPRPVRRLPARPPRSSARTRSFRARAAGRARPAAAAPGRQARPAAGVARGLRRGRARPPPHLAPLRAAPGPTRSRCAARRSWRGGARLARAPAGERRRRHGLEPRLDRQPLRPPRRRRPGARAPARPCSRSPPCRTCSTTTRRSRSTATSAAPPASRRCCCRATRASWTCCRRSRGPGPTAASPACARAAASRSTSPGRAASSSARSSARRAAGRARCATAARTVPLETRAGGTITLDGTLRSR